MPPGPELASVDLGIPGLGQARLIGRGGFGVVYSAFDEQLGERVAVKVLPPEIGERDRASFQRECETVQRMSGHPNVVRYHRSGYTGDGRPYVVMELVEGGTVADLIRQEGALGWARSVELLLPIADAIGFAHRRGILHHDIKPENILLSRDGLVPKLADFGIASLEDQTQTGSTSVPASLAHTAPEALDGHRDQRSDLYSLASTLYHCVAGHPPFSWPGGDSLSALIKRVLTAPVPPIEGEGPSDIDHFFAAAMAKEPEQRPANSHEFVTWLAAVGSEESDRVLPTVLVRPAATERFPFALPGGPIGSAAAVVGGIAGLAALIGLWLAFGPTNSGTEPDGSDDEELASAVAEQTTSTSAPPVAIPNVVGFDRPRAEGTLAGLDLQVEVTLLDLPVGDGRDGTVLSQLPAPPLMADPGTTVELVVGRACTTTTQTVPGQTIVYLPPHQGTGDRDFFGHGPEVSLDVVLQVDDNAMSVTVDFAAIETTGDLTEASGTTDHPLVLLPAESTIHSTSIGLAPGDRSSVYNDLRVLGGTETGIAEVNDNPLVARVTYFGDTVGPEAGTKTQVTVETKPFEISLVEPGCQASA